MFLVSQTGEFLIIAIIGIIIIAVALLVYFIVTNKNKNEKVEISPNFETKNLEVKEEKVEEAPNNIE